MNILLMTSPEPRISPFSTAEKCPPLGVGSLISVLKNAGHSVYFSDEYLRPTNTLKKNFLIENKIDYVGLYMDTICYEGGLRILEKIKQAQKRGWKGKIMVGGPHASVKAEDIPDYVDFIVMGEGERAILDIVEGKVNRRIVTGKRIQNLDSLPRPAWEEFVKLPYKWSHWWIDAHPVFTLNTSRGCPFNCKFCSVKAIWGKTYRMMSAKRIFEDMEYLKNKYGAQCIYFREDNFTLNKIRITRLCDIIIENNTNIDWMCETRADSLQDSEFVSLMAQAGCKAFYIGVESGSQRMLDFMNKGETVQQFVNAFDNTRKAGIKTYASFIFGLPTETKEDVQLTEKLIKRIKPDFTGRNIFVALPGSELYDYVKENNLHEYEGKNGLLYLKGHNKRVNKYYGRKPHCKIPGTSSDWEFRVYDFLNRLKDTYKNRHKTQYIFNSEKQK